MYYIKRIFLLFVLIISIPVLCGCFSENDKNKENERPPMLMYNDTLYKTALPPSENLSLEKVGEVQSYRHGVPKENFQANHNLVGYKILIDRSYSDYIFVKADKGLYAYKILEDKGE